MKLENLVDDFGLEVKSSPTSLGREIAGAYVSDLLSDVIANAAVGDVWITLQLHVNIVAVASMKELSGIIIINGRQPEHGQWHDGHDCRCWHGQHYGRRYWRCPAVESASRCYWRRTTTDPAGRPMVCSC